MALSWGGLLVGEVPDAMLGLSSLVVLFGVLLGLESIHAATDPADARTAITVPNDIAKPVLQDCKL